MKVLVQVDQQASIIAGFDAPLSAVALELNPAHLSEPARRFIAPRWNPQTGEITVSSYDWRGSGGGEEGDRIPRLTAPVTVERALAQLEADTADYQAGLVRQAEQELADQPANERKKKLAREVIATLGTPTQRERLARGLMGDPVQEAFRLARNDVFKAVPLDVATGPSVEDVYMPDDLPDNLNDCEILTKEVPADDLTDAQMDGYIVAEKAIRDAVPSATIAPWELQASRDFDKLGWYAVVVARATIQHPLGKLVRDFALP